MLADLFDNDSIHAWSRRSVSDSINQVRSKLSCFYFSSPSTVLLFSYFREYGHLWAVFSRERFKT
jgi:hypothetical protein